MLTFYGRNKENNKNIYVSTNRKTRGICQKRIKKLTQKERDTQIKRNHGISLILILHTFDFCKHVNVLAISNIKFRGCVWGNTCKIPISGTAGLPGYFQVLCQRPSSNPRMTLVTCVPPPPQGLSSIESLDSYQ